MNIYSIVSVHLKLTMTKYLTFIIFLLTISCSDSETRQTHSNLDYDPKISDSLLSIVLNNWRTIDTDTAIIILERAKKADSTNWSAFANISRFYLDSYDLPSYRENYKEMTRLFPDYWKSYYELGLLSIYLENDTAKSLEYFSQSIKALERDGKPTDKSGKIEHEVLRAKLLYLNNRNLLATQIIDSLKSIDSLPKEHKEYLKDYQFKSIDEQMQHLEKEKNAH